MKTNAVKLVHDAPTIATTLLLEYEAVLQRPEQQRASGMNPKDVEGAARSLHQNTAVKDE
jgi:hypothetical protein